MQPIRRGKTLFPDAMKHRKNNNLSIFVVVFSFLLSGVFMCNEDVKSIAEFPFSRPKGLGGGGDVAEEQAKRANPIQETVKNEKVDDVISLTVKDDDGEQQKAVVAEEEEIVKQRIIKQK